MLLKEYIASRNWGLSFLWSFLLILVVLVITVEARSLEFGSPKIKWKVRKSRSLQAPGPNWWRNTKHTVFIDNQGQLHLKLRKIGKRWWASEILTDRKFGYGEFIFYLKGDLDKLPPQAVVGMFLYKNDRAEMDIELTRWGKTSEKRLLNYSLHTVSRSRPTKYLDYNKRFAIADLKSQRETTHKIIWKREYVEFVSYSGHTQDTEAEIARHRINSDEMVIPKGKMSIRVNFYWFDANYPEDGPEEYEIILNGFEYKPCGDLK
ncbi:MAG: hypothetical protein Kow0037_01390 [Calditrichia bacterium]